MTCLSRLEPGFDYECHCETPVTKLHMSQKSPGMQTVKVDLTFIALVTDPDWFDAGSELSFEVFRLPEFSIVKVS